MANFRAAANESMYLLALDQDDTRLVSFNDNTAPVLSVGGGHVRDPSLFRHSDGYWYVAHTPTNGTAGSTVFGLAKAPSLLGPWTSLADVSMVAASGAGGTCWSPEWFVDDDGPHVFIAVSSNPTSGPFQIFETHPTNAAFTTWSTPVAVTGTGLPANMIDPCVVKIGATYHLVYKNEATSLIERATSSSLLTGYSVVASGDHSGWGSGLEGPTLFQRADGSWRLVVDKYATTSGPHYADSTDNLETWSALTQMRAYTSDLRHGTVVAI